jgi:hypothetical protein
MAATKSNEESPENTGKPSIRNRLTAVERELTQYNIAIKEYVAALKSGQEVDPNKSKQLLANYNKHKKRFQLNNQNVKFLRQMYTARRKINERDNKAAANAAEQQRLENLAKSLLTNNNTEFLTGYKKLGMFGTRKFMPKNKQALNNKYTRIMKAAANKAAANKAVANKAATEKKAANKAVANKAAAEKKAANNTKAAANAEKKAPNALKNYLVATVKPRYNKALVNAILKLPDINNNTRRRLQAPRMYALQRGAGALGRGAVTAGGALGNKARGFFSRSAAGTATGGGFFSRLFAPKPVRQSIPFKAGMKIPFGYVLKTGNEGTGLYKNNKGLALESQLEHRGYVPAPKPTGTNTGVSIGVGPSRYRNNYGYGNNYGNRYGNNRRGPGAPSGGIVFAPKINVGAARIGAQTFGGTRVGGQQMGGSRATTGNVGGTRVTTGNGGRLAVSAPTTNGNRQLAATPEQLIRGAGGAEAVEQGIKALNAANGNVARAKATSKLPNNTFTNIYAMGGPVAAKRLVESRRRRRTVGARGARVKARSALTKKRVAQKPRKKYIKLTPYQFRRLTDHIKKNNLRKVLIKEITH